MFYYFAILSQLNLQYHQKMAGNIELMTKRTLSLLKTTVPAYNKKAYKKRCKINDDTSVFAAPIVYILISAQRP